MTARNKVLLGILGAAVAGVIIGFLSAPEKGNETRRRLKKTTGKWVNGMGRIFTRNNEKKIRRKVMESPIV